MLSKKAKEMYAYFSDENLWADFKSGDEQAYEYIFKKFYSLLLNYGLKINQNRDEIKDCIQHLFTGLWESRERLSSVSSIRSYLSASLRRIILRRLRDKFNLVNIEDINPDFYADISSELKYIRNQMEVEQAQLLSDLIKELPDRQREALYLKYYNDYSFAEIAETMGITTRAVYKLIYKALAYLSLQIGDKKLELLSSAS